MIDIVHMQTREPFVQTLSILLLLFFTAKSIKVIILITSEVTFYNSWIDDCSFNNSLCLSRMGPCWIQNYLWKIQVNQNITQVHFNNIALLRSVATSRIAVWVTVKLPLLAFFRRPGGGLILWIIYLVSKQWKNYTSGLSRVTCFWTEKHCHDVCFDPQQNYTCVLFKSTKDPEWLSWRILSWKHNLNCVVTGNGKVYCSLKLSISLKERLVKKNRLVV